MMFFENVSADSSEKALSLGISVSKKKGEIARRFLDASEVLKQNLKPFVNADMLVFPIRRMLSEFEKSELNKLLDDGKIKESEKYHEKKQNFKISESYFQVRATTLLVRDFLGYDPTYEIIGDIAIIEDDAHKTQIAGAILSVHKSVKTVLLSNGPVSGEFRTRAFQHVAGENKSYTVHKEYGCIYHINLEKAYFTQRLSAERARILPHIKDGDFVIDMFAGVGPYSILICKKRCPKIVVANDKNPDAFNLLEKNICENKVKNIIPLNMDAADLLETYEKSADHVIMNLPHGAFLFLNTAVRLCKNGGRIYYYAMAHETDLYSNDIKRIQTAASQNGRAAKIVEKRSVRSYAPHQYNICIEAEISDIRDVSIP